MCGVPRPAAPRTPVPGAAARRRRARGQRGPDCPAAGTTPRNWPATDRRHAPPAGPRRLSAPAARPGSAPRRAAVAGGRRRPPPPCSAGSAYVMGGDPAPAGGAAAASPSCSGEPCRSAPGRRQRAGVRRRGPPCRLGLTGEPDFTPPERSRGAARRPALAGLDMSRAARTRLPPRLGPCRGARRRTRSWNCASRTAGTSPRSSNSTLSVPRAARRAGAAPQLRRSTC